MLVGDNFFQGYPHFLYVIYIYYKKYTDMAISEKELKKIVNESVRQVLSERRIPRLTENVLGFLISKETFDEIKMGENPEAVLVNHLFDELNWSDCVHFVSRMIIKKIRGEM